MKTARFQDSSRSFQLKGAGVELIIGALFGHQLFVAAALDDASVIQHHNNIRVLYGRQTVGDHKDCPPLHQSVHAILHQRLGAGVDG